MKRKILIGALVVAALAVLTTGVVVAQSPQPPAPGAGGLGNGRGPMRLSAEQDGEGPLHEYMMAAFGDALGISADEFESRHEEGESAYAIALDLGFTADKIPALLRAARISALDAAAAAGVITAEQSNWMGSRPFGRGSGNCDGTGYGLGMGMGGWRFQQPNP